MTRNLPRFLTTSVVAVAVALVGAGVPVAMTAAETTTPTRYVVRAGHADLLPPGDEKPYVHTAFYPDYLEVHTGDQVEWRFGEGYGGWHSVLITEKSTDAASFFRADEIAGAVMLDEDFGAGRYPNGDPCGRIGWYDDPPLEPCELNADTVKAGVGSAAFERFFSTNDAGGFVAKVNLPVGSYAFGCTFHPDMRGTLEVVPPTTSVRSQAEIDEEAKASFAADRAAADDVVAELGDSRQAWDPIAREWVVRVGADTPDRRVGIYQFLPSNIPARRGDRVRFVAHTQEPNSVAFVGDQKLQGGFNMGGRCGASHCTDDGTHAPWALTGLAYPWLCEYDAPNGGAPGVPATFVSPRITARIEQTGLAAGCPSVDDVEGAIEFEAGPYMAYGQPAPGNFVVDDATFHNSGIVMDATLPDSYRRHPHLGWFPSEFEAVFPNAGSFAFVCNAHEFMNGAVNVS